MKELHFTYRMRLSFDPPVEQHRFTLKCVPHSDARQEITALTTAEQAMALGQGVCQDYAHILLSLCRMEQIPCRYAVGMLLGEGLSHAWVEIADGERWYALDPTNRLLVDDQHIKISAGRDYTDCTINQGLFVGRTRQTQQAVVSVQEEKKP